MPFRPTALRAFAVAAATALWLAACAHYAQIGPGDVAIHDRLDVTLDRGWNRQVHGPTMMWPESWTQNGPFLDMLVIAPGIEHDRALVRLPERELRDFPRFRSGSTPTDIVELVQATLTKTANAGDFVAVSTEPAQIAGQDGVRFEFKFGTGNGGDFETDRHALGFAFEHDKKLYLVLFHAAEIHYFADLRPAVEAIVASARLSRARTASR